MKTVIKFLMIALSIAQIDAFAISSPRVLNTYRPFSTPEKKQQFQNRSSLWPWTGLILTTGIGTGLFYHYFFSSKSPNGMTQRYSHANARTLLKNLKDTSSNIGAGLFATGSENSQNTLDAANKRRENLKKMPDAIQDIGTGMKWFGYGSAVIPLIASTAHDNRSLIPAAIISAGIGITGTILENQTISHRITDR